jgi:hypothetical protein
MEKGKTHDPVWEWGTGRIMKDDAALFMEDNGTRRFKKEGKAARMLAEIDIKKCAQSSCNFMVTQKRRDASL